MTAILESIDLISYKSCIFNHVLTIPLIPSQTSSDHNMVIITSPIIIGLGKLNSDLEKRVNRSYILGNVRVKNFRYFRGLAHNFEIFCMAIGNKCLTKSIGYARKCIREKFQNEGFSKNLYVEIFPIYGS